jgi:aspartate aminotransferase
MFYELAERALALEREGKRVIRLNIGGTNLPTPKCAVEAAAKCMRSGKSGYGSSAGLFELREKIAQREECEVENVVVGAGAKPLLFALFSVLGKPGGKVAMPSPHWPAYELAARQLGMKPMMLKTKLEDSWAFDAMEMKKCDVAVICNPLNPASTVYNEALVQEAIGECAKSKTHLILDEAYKGLSFKAIPKYDTIRVRSFSKEFCMEGWRLGYVVAEKEIAKKIISFNQITTTCVPEFVQRAGIACLENEKGILKENRGVWKKRLFVAQQALGKAGFEFAKPQAGIYIFATHRGIEDADLFAMRLLGEGVAVASGSDFGGYKKFIRICPNQKIEMLKEAFRKVSAALCG